ncbi:MAG: c-type cytochrome domain-containing protein [Prosthecobacter sp.]
MKRVVTVVILLTALTLAACQHLRPALESGPPVDFMAEIKPLLESRCLECHQRRYVCAGLNMETKTLAMKGGRSGPVIIPGAPHHSLLYKVLLLGHENPVAMPPTPEKLEQEHQKMVHDWIRQGAHWPQGVHLVPPQDWRSPRSQP